jgi:Zn-dependent M28 family amino/carboxypeptidase
MRLRPSLAIAAAACIALPLVAAAPAAAHPSHPAKPTKPPLEERVTEAAVYGHLEQFQAIADANDGNRAFNTAGYEASATYIEKKLRKAGYTTTRQEFSVEGAVEESELTVAGINDTFTPAAFQFSPYTTEPLTAALVQPGDALRQGCVAEDWAGIDATDDIAFISRGTCNFSLKVLNAAAAGASAVIVYNNVAGPIGNGTLGAEDPGYVPAVSIPLEQAQPILTALGAGSATATLTVLKTDATTFNVLAETPTGRADNVVMLGAHLDGVEDGAGINDNASGSAALLETAVQLMKDKKSINNKVRFAWWGAEEIGLVGSDHYVNDLVANDAGELDRIATYLNFDMIASPNYIVGVYDADESTYPAPVPVPDGSIATEKIFTDYFDGIGQPWVDTEFSGRSDYQAFIANGIPASGLFTGADGEKTAEEVALFGGTEGVIYDPNYHTPGDDISNVNREALGIMSTAIAHATAALADDTYAVNGVATPGKRPVVKITSPTARDTVRGSLTATGTATDDYALADDTVTVHLRNLKGNGKCDGFLASQTVPVDDGAWTATWDAGIVPDGEYCLTALTKDNAGQENAGGGTHVKYIMLTDGLPKMTGVSARSQCSANGKASVAVYAVNGEQRPVDVRLSTTFADKKFTGVPAGSASYAFLQTKDRKLGAGTATVAAYYWADGKGYHETYDVAYSSIRCR